MDASANEQLIFRMSLLSLLVSGTTLFLLKKNLDKKKEAKKFNMLSVSEALRKEKTVPFLKQAEWRKLENVLLEGYLDAEWPLSIKEVTPELSFVFFWEELKKKFLFTESTTLLSSAKSKYWIKDFHVKNKNINLIDNGFI